MHYPDFYAIVSKPWRTSAQGGMLLAWIDKALVGIIAASYGVTIVWLLAQGDTRLMRVVLVPAIVLVLVTIIREVVNAPRPYETYAIEPLVKHTTQGRSFPSRHVTSAFIIACALGYVHVGWGIAAGIAACLVAYARVATGAHFPRDVVAGAVLALVCGLVGFVFI